MQRSSRLLSTLCSLAAAALVPCLATLAAAGSPVVWGTIETVTDQPGVLPERMTEMCTFGRLGGEPTWLLVHERDGDVYVSSRDAGTWSEQLLVAGPHSSTSPIIEGDDVVHVVWEDDRGGDTEIWTKRWDGGSWTSEECLSCEDAVSSMHPTLAESGGKAVVAWEDVGGAILTRRFASGVWQPAETFLASGGSWPAVDSRDGEITGDIVGLAWLDDRNGDPDVYCDWAFNGSGLSWNGETRVSSSIGEGAPRVHMTDCCTDNPFYWRYVSYEGGGGVELAELGVGGPTYRSFGGSGSPSLHGFPFSVRNCFTEGPLARFFLARSSGATIEVGYYSWINGTLETTSLTSSALSGAGVRTNPGSPEAGALVYWVQEGGTGPALVATVGATVGCSELAVEGPARIIVSPDGYDNTLQLVDQCSGIAESNGDAIVVNLDATLLSSIFLDEDEDDPPYTLYPAGDTYTLSIRAGGCAQAGNVTVSCELNSGIATSYGGVTSPDVDGNCTVDQSDLEYVQSALGTDEFCADIDGSGLVDEDDVAIVLATFGASCSGVADAPVPGGDASRFDLEIAPNPARGTLRLSLAGTDGADSALRFFDAGGRLVRGVEVTGTGREGGEVLQLDLTDGRGSPLTPGVYWVVAQRADGAASSEKLVIVD
ncbi:MAG: hypothetical protein R3E97_19315 [Candidatus Eisenbacteria bacterium]